MSEDFSPFKSGMQTTNAVIANRYELLQLIGQGAMSKVYKGRDGNLGRVVAIKFLREEYGQNQSFVARFYREARAVASLPDEHLVSIYDYGQHGLTYFIVMEFVDGKNLKELLRQEGPFSPEKVIELVTPVLLALRAAHARGIIHRDVKPQNVLVRKEDGAVKLTDFGVAHTIDSVQVTSVGMVIGTVDYMAPEQARGETVGPPADLYAVGVVMFELLTGHLPYTGDNTMQVIMGHIQQPIPSVASQGKQIPPAMERVIQRALAKDARARFQSAQEMLNALEMVTNQRGEESVFNAATATETPVWPSQEKSVTSQPTSLNPVRPPEYDVVQENYVPNEASYSPVEEAYIEQPRPRPVAPNRVNRSTPKQGQANRRVPPDRVNRPGPRSNVAPPQKKSSAWVWVLLLLIVMLAVIGGVVYYLLSGQTENRGANNPPNTPPLSAPVNTTAAAIVTTAQAQVTTAAPAQTTVNAIATTTPAPATAPVSVNFDYSSLEGAYERNDSTLFGRTEKALYGVGSQNDKATITFKLDKAPSGQPVLKITGIDDELAKQCAFQVMVNDTQVFNGPNTFPAAPKNDTGEGGKDRGWGTMTINVPASALKAGQNTITLRNLENWTGNLGVPYILINSVSLQS